ncbi:thiol-disulfide isomerase/thioredoxin [Runella defluvii]|uniref:Thiol-disulfide isomerase/thioredoxin n=1 Tax=Runella defluvii TaxID=370973 RepID=A0A7W5ZMC7_9BACT|nr:TlpA disulfide reductase family protein [Runella defluvii]MBB3838511.1 thiol-disulfide isomerase/thioredoxin [Runella defluvii]
MKNLFSFLLVFFVIKSLAQVKNVKITIKANGSKPEKIQMTATDMVRDVPVLLLESKFDSSGGAYLNFNLANSQFVAVMIGDKYCKLYLTPNDNLTIGVDFKNPTAPLEFQGDGAPIARHLYDAGRTLVKIMGVSTDELDTQAYLNKLDTLQTELAKVHNLHKNTLPNNVNVLLINSYRMFDLYSKQIKEHNLQAKKKEIPLVLQNISDSVPFDAALLSARDEAYSAVLAFYWLNKLSIVYKENKDLNNFSTIYPKLTVSKIKSESYPKEFKELLIAKTINDGLRILGITPITEALYQEFKQEYSTSPYLTTLEERYNQWSPLAKGKPAPEIAGLTSDDKMLSTNAFKGKVIYVDVWATWCGPCRAEFPKALELQKQFEGNEKVVFLNVSVDKNRQQWKKLLTDKRTPKGYHINQSNPDLPESIYKSYKIGGIPRYILIDQEGKIVSADAPYPSSGKVEDEIRALLK